MIDNRIKPGESFNFDISGNQLTLTRASDNKIVAVFPRDLDEIREQAERESKTNDFRFKAIILFVAVMQLAHVIIEAVTR